MKVEEDIEKNWGIDDKFIIDHVSRFIEAKNHKFILGVFEEIESIVKEKHYVIMLNF